MSTDIMYLLFAIAWLTVQPSEVSVKQCSRLFRIEWRAE